MMYENRPGDNMEPEWGKTILLALFVILFIGIIFAGLVLSAAWSVGAV